MHNAIVVKFYVNVLLNLLGVIGLKNLCYKDGGLGGHRRVEVIHWEGEG